MQGIFLFCLFCFVRKVVLTTPTREELLLQDPSLWPGHLEPFGSKQVTSGVEEINEWPEPAAFFKEYVDKSRPVLFKGLAKTSPAFSKFNDDYFKNAPDADKTMIYAELEKKENRTKPGYTISIREFIDRYHKETLYMVNALPKQFTPDIRIPAPLRCETTRDLVASQVTWFSSGGTKSVLHNDDVDNINCLFRGSKELWFIDYKRNTPYVPIDVENGGYSSLDVEKVNYTAFPDLRKVDVFHRVVMEEGDCVFIPYLWFHQVNSFANADRMNLAVNVWFKPRKGHVPEKCDIPVSEATIDKWHFPFDEEEKEGDEKSYVKSYFESIDGESVSYGVFMIRLKRDEMVNPTLHEFKGYPDLFKELGARLFHDLDVNEDRRLNAADWDEIRKWDVDKVEDLDRTLDESIVDLEHYFRDLVQIAAESEDPKKEDSEKLQEPDDLQKDLDELKESDEPKNDNEESAEQTEEPSKSTEQPELHEKIKDEF